MALNDKDSEAKKKPHEISNAEYVSKLMAATPSYFFTPPQAGHNFFFSELLRSLVQKRKAEELNVAAMKAKTVTKKIRKPPFHQFQKAPAEQQEYKKPKLSDETVKIAETVDNDQENSQDSVINVDKDDPPPTTTTSNLAPSIPPSLAAQSAFYPYVDPLHFFIDLKVSAGQIYDRKKEAYLQQALKNNNNILLDSTWNCNNNPIIGRNRNSAFKVPISSSSEISQIQNFNAINLISNQESTKGFQKIYKSSRSDDDEIQENNSGNHNKNEEDTKIFELDKSTESKRI